MNEANLMFRGILREQGLEFCDDDYEPDGNFIEDSSTDGDFSELLIASAVEASSFDRPDQSIDRVLENDDTFWSSEGTSVEERETVEEYLTFKMKHPLNLVKTVEITVFRASFQFGGPIYPPDKMTIYTGPSKKNLRKASDEFKIHPHEAKQVFQLPFGQQLIGNFIQFVFRGKQQRQREDNLYYIAIRKLDALGVKVHSSNLMQLNKRLKSDWMRPVSNMTFTELSHHYNVKTHTPPKQTEDPAEELQWWIQNEDSVNSVVFDFHEELERI